MRMVTTDQRYLLRHRHLCRNQGQLPETPVRWVAEFD